MSTTSAGASSKKIVKINFQNQKVITRFGKPTVIESNQESTVQVEKSWLIDHESTGCKIWVFSMFFFSFVTSFIYAILAAYRDQVDSYI